MTIKTNMIEKYKGKKATVNYNGMHVEVIITNVKRTYGRERFQVKPVAGKGKIWVEKVNLKK